MSISSWYEAKYNAPGRVLVGGSFRPNGATGVVSGSSKGRNWSVARTSTGLYTVTFGEWGVSLESFHCSLREAAATPTFVQAGDVSSSNRTAQIRVMQASALTKTIPINLASGLEIATNAVQNLAAHGGALCNDSVPDFNRVNGATDKALRLEWGTGETDEIQFAPIPKPADLDSSQNVTVHLMMAKGSNTDAAAVVGVNVWDGVGDSNCGGDTAALSVATLAEYTVTVLASNIAAPPGFLNIGVIPGTHANDVEYLYAAWLEYTSTDIGALALTDLAADADNEIDFLAVFRNTTEE